MTRFYAVIEIKQFNKSIKEKSQLFDTQLQAEMWLNEVLREAKKLKIKVLDHIICKA